MAATAETDAVQAPIPGQIISYQFGSGGMLASAGVDWDSYTKVLLERATVEFRENWVSDQRKINDSFVREADVERIKTEMSDLLDRVLTRKLSDKDGYTLTVESGTDVLRFTPRIAKLDIHAPGRAQEFVGHVLIDSKGSMVLVMDISDSVSGELLASCWQLQGGPRKGLYGFRDQCEEPNGFWTDDGALGHLVSQTARRSPGGSAGIVSGRMSAARNPLPHNDPGIAMILHPGIPASLPAKVGASLKNQYQVTSIFFP